MTVYLLGGLLFSSRHALMMICMTLLIAADFWVVKNVRLERGSGEGRRVRATERHSRY